jgi:signal transduction histidine kinase/HD-like signal output (HDOD) protein
VSGPSRQLEPKGEPLTDRQLDVLVRELGDLPTLPGIAARVIRSASTLGEDPAARENLAALIELDPVLSVKILRSAAPEGDDSKGISGAIDRVSDEKLLSAMLSLEVCQPPLGEDEPDAVDLPGLWKHSLAVGLAARMLAERIRLPNRSDDAMLCGLLHDIGKIALGAALPKSYARVWTQCHTHQGNIIDYERETLGTDHCTFARRLAQHWKLPRSVQDVLWLHVQPIEAIPQGIEHRPLVALVGLADAIARKARIGASGNYAFTRSPEQTASLMNVPDAVLKDVQDRLGESVAQAAETLGLDAPADPADLIRTLMGANARLGRINEKLRRQSRHLSNQTNALRRIRQFAVSLPADSTVADLLVYIGNSIADARSSHSAGGADVVAYSIEPSSREILAVRCNGQDRSDWRALAPAKGFAATPPAADASTGAVLEALLDEPSQLGDWVDSSDWIHRPMVSASRWVGGLLCAPLAISSREYTVSSWALVEAMSLVLAVVQERNSAMALSEQLAGASQVLAETQDAIADIKMMAAVEQMAAGAAHEINNPLAVIAGRAQLMAERAEDDDQRQTWQTISEQAQRVSDIISDLMEYAAPTRPRPRPVAVDQLFQQAADTFSESSQDAAIYIDNKGGDDMPPVWVDRSQICSVLVELIRNGVEAAESQPQIHLLADADEVNDAVRLTVRDNGTGMDEQTLSRATMPFFSARQAGRRRGLGLSKAKRIVEMNGGKLWIDSTLYRGTSVHVRLPAIRGESSPQ